MFHRPRNVAERSFEPDEPVPPVHKARFPLNREITLEEYESAIAMARELGFENLYLQSMATKVHNLPNFDNTENPFPLDCTQNQDNVAVWQL